MNSSRYDFWLLDLDGTLVDVESRYIHSVFDRVSEHLNHAFTDREAETLWHGLGGLRNDQLRAWGLDTDLFWRTFHEVENPTARAAATFLYDDAAAFLDSLDVPVGVVTHCQQYLTEPVLSRLDLHERFDTVVCCTGEIGWKPNPAPVRLAMEQMSVETGKQGALVGDGPQDVGAAWNAGLDGIHIERHGHKRRGWCVRGDRRVARLNALL